MVRKRVGRTKRRRLRFQYLPLDKIDVSLSNVRKSNLEKGIEELGNSIREIGLQQPVVVSEKVGNRYELIIGQRRYLACQKIGEKRVPALITKVGDRTEGIIKSFSENIHRLDLDYRDKMRVATELLKTYKTIKKVAKSLGVSPPTVKRYLGYAAVPKAIKKMVDEGRLHATTAIEIVQNVDDEKRAIEVARKLRELPRSEDKRYFIGVAREMEDKSPGEALKIAKKRSKMKSITIHVTKRIYDAVVEASERYGIEIEYVVTEAVEEWLTSKGLLNEKTK